MSAIETIEKVRKAGSLYEEALKSMTKYDLERLVGYAEALFRNAPLKIGDRVKLLVTPEISEKEGWGWIGYKHVLVAGHVGTVCEVDCYDDRLVAMVEFDGVKEMYDGRKLFCFSMSSLEKLP